jgi:hypothetical protein
VCMPTTTGDRKKHEHQAQQPGRIIISRLLSCGLAVGLLLTGALPSPALAIPFIHKKQKPQLPNIPPTTQTQPGMLQAPAVPPVVKTPVVQPDRTQILVQKGVFPPEAMTHTEPITRAEWARILVLAIGHNTHLYSEFPFYRDVPTTDPNYVSIEVAREKKLIVYEDNHGFYHPQKPMTYAEAYESISHAITGPPPDPELWPHLLKGFTDSDQLPAKTKPAVAKMARVKFFRTPKPQTELHPNEAMTFVGATPLVTELIQLIQQRTPLQAENETMLANVPAGLELTLSPTTSILETNLDIGQNVSFTLVNPVGPLPKESRFTGQIISATPAARTYTVNLTTVKTPEGAEYNTEAQFTIGFSPRSRINFLVPGELFSAMNEYPKQGAQEVQATPPASTPSVEPQPKLIVPFAPLPAPNVPQRPKLSRPGETPKQPTTTK